MGEWEKVFNELQKVGNTLDNIAEPVLSCDRGVLEEKLVSLKQSDGEGWAIGESIQRILNAYNK